MATFSDVNFFMGSKSPNTLVLDADAINQNIILILTTPIRSKWFRPRLGSNIPNYLFDPVDHVTADAIKLEAQTVLSRNGELRVTVTDVEVIPNPEEQYYFVSVKYTSQYLNPSEVTFNFNLRR